MSGRREPLVADDVGTWFRVWRCSRCGTLWREDERRALPIGETEADEVYPVWRDLERWVVTTPLPLVLQQYRAGQLGDRLCVLALLHHDVLGTDQAPEDPTTQVLYSSPEAAVADGRDPAALSWGSVARRLRCASGRRRVVFDPASPWWCDMNDWVIEYLDANGRRTVTEADRRRGGDAT
ncbi:hypothetical protein [Cellulomonas triticagri]|uniref:Uncharacterized protein n=1 Tax=Cellulomonas triticagri TaxID=2483352 RepID=A0A3M2JIR9_9CELL|nr:hypothetical protein [Cellulomonas triticagri]RMI13559.1 hypothetical protein EBM89_03885 [Cellulomonas triticagri]